MNRTSIEWTDFTANPLKFRDQDGKVVWACVHASPGCQHCYAETLAKRYGRGGPFTVPQMRGLTPFLDDAELHKMLTYKPAAGKRVFVGDMTDVFGEWVPDDLLDQLFAVFVLRPDVTWQVLTKRAKRLAAYFQAEGVLARIAEAAHALAATEGFTSEPASIKSYAVGPGAEFGYRWFVHPFPLPNVWIGVSCEDQQRADERIPLLLQTPATVRFISAEPLLGPVDARKYLTAGDSDNPHEGSEHSRIDGDVPAARVAALQQQRPRWDKSIGHEQGDQKAERPAVRTLDWVIAGAESGSGARPCDARWLNSLVQQCRTAGVACFVKQVGPWLSVTGDEPAAPGYTPWRRSLRMKDRKGGDPSEWPEALRVRQFPRSAVSA